MNRCLFVALCVAIPSQADEPIKVGVIGLDTGHAPAFVKLFNDADAKPDVAGLRVVVAYAQGSRDIPSSVKRVPEYTAQVQALGVEIVDSIDELVRRVDCVLLESNDGRPHAEQVLPVLRAGKPVFIDKPVAGTLADAVRIFQAADHFKVPAFGSSALRFSDGAQAIRAGKLGRVLGADAYSPCELQGDHPDLFWYGVHGVETLFTVMGTGCKTVARTSTKDADVAVGTWDDGRVGTFRGMRVGKPGYGGTAFGAKGTEPIGPFGGYRPLAVQIAAFFRTRTPPVEAKETLELYAFMEAADESKRRGGAPVALQDVLDKAMAEAAERPLR